MKATTRNATKWLLSLVFALVVISLILIPQVLKVESEAAVSDWSASTINIDNASDLITFLTKVNNNDSTFSGQTINLTADINVNPGWSASVQLTGNVGAGLSASTGTVILPSTPSTSWPMTGKGISNYYPTSFEGTFNGQGHTISGVRAYTTAQTRAFGLLFGTVKGTVQNLRITNSVIIYNCNAGLGGGGFGGLAGVNQGTIQNCYVSVDMVLQSADGYCKKLAIGGIAGWSDGVTANCIYQGLIVTTNGQNSTSYPCNGTRRHIGGILGEQEDGSCTDCIGMPVFAVREAAKGFQSTDQNTESGGCNKTICGNWKGTGYGESTRVNAGPLLSNPGSYTDFRNTGVYSYVPSSFASTFPLTASGTIHITSTTQLLDLVNAVDRGEETFYNKTIYLDQNIDLNPGWDASVTLSGSTGMGLSASTGTVTLPSAPSTVWTNHGLPNRGFYGSSVSSCTSSHDYNTNLFKGTFDGQGYTISGVYAVSRTKSRSYGILFNKVNGGTVRNVIITNSVIIQNNNNNNGGPGFGGLSGALISGTVSNIYVEADLVWQSNQAQRYAIGGILGWQEGGTFSNAIYKGKIVETSAADDLTYPSGKTSRHIGGVAGECEGGTATDCIGMPTFAVSEPSVSIQSSDQKTTTGGANLAVAGHYGSDRGTLTRVYEGARTSNPGNSYADYTASSLGSWVPSGFASTFVFLNGVSIDDYTFDGNYFPGSWVTINSMSEFNTFRSGLYSSGSYGSGITFKLTTDLDFNPGWNASPTVSGGTVSWPSNPGNFERIRNFYGTLDGQGHTISGIYAERSTGAVDGAFFWHFHGTLKNIAFTNSIVLYNRGTNGGGRNYGVGFLAGDAEGTFENIYLDVEVWAKANNNVALAVLAPNALGTTTVTNFTFRGRFAVADNSNNYNYSASGQNAQGLLFGNGSAKTITVNHALFDFECGAPNLLTDEGDEIMLVRYDRGGLTLNDVVTLATQTSSRAGWTNQMSSIGTWTPSSVVPSRYVITGNNLALSNYDNRYYYKPGSSFAINTFSDYNTFVTKINADSSYGYGYIFKITADMNVNPNWRAKGEVEWDGSAGGVEFAPAPGNPWPVLNSFRGTLDGQGHVLEGLYGYYNVTGDQNNAGLFVKDLGTNATIKDLLIRNSRLVGKFSGSNNRMGGIAAYASGSNITLKNIYLDVEIVALSWNAQIMGGFIGGINGANYTLNNLMFAGNLYLAKPSSSLTSLSLPSTSTGAYITELIANYNYRTTVYATQIVLNGSRYASATVLGRNKWQGLSNSSDDAWGTKMRYDWLMIDGLDANDERLSRYTEREDNFTEYFAGPFDQASVFSGIDGTDAFSYSDGLSLQVPIGLQAMIDTAISEGRFHNFDPVTISIMDYTGSEISGSIFTIANASQLVHAVNLSQDNNVTFSGYTLRLTADIDLNPGWTGHVAVSNGKATLPNLPVNIFRGFKIFSGTFDGGNYYISGIFMLGTMTDFSFHLAPFIRTNGATIKRLKLINGLILAQDNYSANGNYDNNKIAGLVARNNGGTLTIDSVYNAMEVWYNGFYGQKIGGFVSINNNGSSGQTLVMNNVKFAGVVGNMSQANSNLSVPNTTSGCKISQLVSDGGSGTVTITLYTMGGTVYESSASSTNYPPAEVTTGTSGTITLGTGDEGAGTATVVSKTYVNPLAEKFATNVYSGSDTPTQYEGAHDTYVYNYKYLSKQDNFNAFGSKLSTNGYDGYTLKQSYQIGNNYYALYENPNEYSLFVTYIETGDSNSNSGSGRGSVFVSPAGTEYNTTKVATAATNLCQPTIWQLDVDNAWSCAGGGMSYVIRLSNGHFIIIDGGYASNYDARHIYKILKENNVLGGKPQVDAWFFTHLHDDHFGAFLKFAANYATLVDIDAFYYNFPSDAVDASEDDEGINTSNIFTMVAAMKSWPNAHLYSKPHAGMTFGFDGLEVTVLATHESVSMYYYDSSWHANSFNDGNDTSMVMKFTFYPGTSKQQVLMINGDACTGISKFLSTAYAAADLKADIIQVSHHGWKGLTEAVYTMMDKYSNSTKKSVFLWPQDVISYTNVNDTYYYSPTAWNGHQTQQGNDYGGNFGYLYTVSQSNSQYGAANYYIKGHAKEVIPAYKDHALTLPYVANSNYAATYWTSSNNSNLQSAYNTKKNTTTNWDGSASGYTVEQKFPIKDWWNNGANSTYEIGDIVDFYNFVYYAKSNDFEGKTVNLNCNVVLNAFNGTVTFDGTQMIVPDALVVWNPIPSFKGTFNGNNHFISGLYSYVTYGNTGTKGGFIKSLGGTIKNLAIINSAIVFKSTTSWGSTNMFNGAIVGEATGTATIQDCSFGVNSYDIHNGASSFAGVVVKVAEGATVNITRVTYAGEIAYVTAGYTKGGAVTVESGQHMYGPMGILGHKNDGTVNLTDVQFVGKRVAATSVSGGSNFSADIYASQVQTGTVNVSGDNNVGGTTGGAAQVTPPEKEDLTEVAPTTAVTPANAPTQVYVPQYKTVMDVAHANQVNPVYSQQSAVADSKTNIRLVGTMTREAAQDAYTLGFKLTIVRSDGKKAVTCTSQYDAYQSINANGENVTAASLGGEYIYAMVLQNLPTTHNYTIYAQTRYQVAEHKDKENPEKITGFTEYFGGLQTFTVTDGVIQ